MNYLQLCMRLRQEVGASGNDATVAGAKGEWKRLCDWIATAWEDIQEEERSWEFMRKEKAFTTVANQAEYAPDGPELALTDFSHWKNRSFRLYQNTVGDERFLAQLEYNQFRDQWLFGNNRVTPGVPIAITIAPTRALILAQPPLDAYTVITEYYALPAKLVDDNDTPSMPERYHMAIVYRAMRHYGMYEAAEEVIARADQEYRRVYERLQWDQLPDVTIAGSFI